MQYIFFRNWVLVLTSYVFFSIVVNVTVASNILLFYIFAFLNRLAKVYFYFYQSGLAICIEELTKHFQAAYLLLSCCINITSRNKVFEYILQSTGKIQGKNCSKIFELPLHLLLSPLCGGYGC